MNTENTLKNDMKKLIYVSGKSLKAFAQEVEISDSYFSRVLNGKAVPSIELSIRISECLGIDPVDFRKRIMDAQFVSQMQK